MCSFHFSLAADGTLPKLLKESRSERRSIILLESQFLFIKVLMLFVLFPELLKRWNVMLFFITAIALPRLSSKNGTMLRDGDPYRALFNAKGVQWLCEGSCFPKTPSSWSYQDHLRGSELHLKTRHHSRIPSGQKNCYSLPQDCSLLYSPVKQ